jgi:hypothetical protein
MMENQPRNELVVKIVSINDLKHPISSHVPEPYVVYHFHEYEEHDTVQKEKKKKKEKT